LIQLNYRDARPIYEQIKDGLQKLILSKAILPDEKMPSVRELAATLAINPNTIQRAYKELEAEGYIYSIPGKGSFASADALVFKNKEKELLEDFDTVVTELFVLGVSGTVLKTRIEKLEQGRND